MNIENDFVLIEKELVNEIIYIQQNFKLLKHNILLYDINLKQIIKKYNNTLLNDFFLNFENQMLNFIIIFKNINNIDNKKKILEMINHYRKINIQKINIYL
jgi:hypothetical protein